MPDHLFSCLVLLVLDPEQCRTRKGWVLQRRNDNGARRGMNPQTAHRLYALRYEISDPNHRRITCREGWRRRGQAAQQVVVPLVDDQIDGAVLRHRLDDVAGAELALQQALGQRIFDQVLDRPAQRARAVLRVVALRRPGSPWRRRAPAARSAARSAARARA